jgi:hypothetical protein
MQGLRVGDVHVLTHLDAFGTPSAINLAMSQGASLPEVDEYVRRWTNDACSLDSDHSEVENYRPLGDPS